MGADVTHPGADQQDSNKPSIAAVVGSVDPRASQYCCEIRIQRSKQEYIEDMEGMVYNLLRKFNRVNGAVSTGKPQRIIFYRDGVSEGQFAKVIRFIGPYLRFIKHFVHFFFWDSRYWNGSCLPYARLAIVWKMATSHLLLLWSYRSVTTLVFSQTIHKMNVDVEGMYRPEQSWIRPLYIRLRMISSSFLTKESR